MRTQSICLALAILLLCPFASAQWVNVCDPWGGVSCITVSGTNLFAGSNSRGGGYLSLSTDSGTNWDKFPTPNINVLAVSGSTLLAGTRRDGVLLFTNNGATWTTVNEGLPRETIDTTIFYSIASLAVSGTNLFAGTWGGGVFLSTDHGSRWTAVRKGLPRFTQDTTGYSSVACIASSGQYLFAGTWNGVFRSTNNGTSWTAVNAGLTDTSVQALAVSPAPGGTGGTYLFAGTGAGGVFRSTNNGTNWTSVNDGLTDLHILTLAVNGTNLFAAPGRGVFLSTNNGTSWIDVGLTAHWANSLAVCGSYLFAGTGSTETGTDGGIWRRALSEIIVSVDNITRETPQGFRLSQSYPNPFNPSTTITFELPKSSAVRLSVYDLLGREVSVLVNERRDAGVYEVTFDGSNLASGVYICRMQVGSFLACRKMISTK